MDIHEYANASSAYSVWILINKLKINYWMIYKKNMRWIMHFFIKDTKLSCLWNNWVNANLIFEFKWKVNWEQILKVNYNFFSNQMCLISELIFLV